MTELFKDQLLELFREKKKHDVGLVIDVLPFLSKRTRAIRGNFEKVLGEYVRKMCNLELDTSKIQKQEEFQVSETGNVLSEHLAEKVEYREEDEKYDFVRFLDNYLFNNEDVKIIHPFLYNYVRVSKNNKNEFSKYGQFMKDVLIKDEKEVAPIFNRKDSDDILTELVLSELDTLKLSKNNSSEYQPLLKSLTGLYQDDLIYLSNYNDYFLSTFPLLTHFYVFMYTCQLVMKFESFIDADYNTIHPLYFSLEWESLSKRRQAASGIESFKVIKEKSRNLFPHIHTMSHLSYNKANTSLENIKNEERINFLTYNQIQTLIDAGKLDKDKFLSELKQWINDYCKFWGINHQSKATNIPEAIPELFNCLKKGMSSTVSKRFGENIEDLGAKHFIKSRGNLGHVFNIKHEFLLLLTAVSVKYERIPLNELFVQFAKRGIALDRYSKKEVVQLLDDLNILDKKSDSGDAQYVKPIL